MTATTESEFDPEFLSLMGQAEDDLRDISEEDFAILTEKNRDDHLCIQLALNCAQEYRILQQKQNVNSKNVDDNDFEDASVATKCVTGTAVKGPTKKKPLKRAVSKHSGPANTVTSTATNTDNSTTVSNLEENYIRVKVISEGGPYEGAEFVVKPVALNAKKDMKRVLIGRSIACLMSFPKDDEVSSEHAMISRTGKKYYIHDKDSTNGVTIYSSADDLEYEQLERNGKHQLQHGMEIGIGGMKLKVYFR